MSREDEIRRILINYHRRLQALEERRALFGMETPVATLTEIEDIKSEIEKLQTQLNELEGKVGNLENKIEPTDRVEPVASEIPKGYALSYLWVSVGMVGVVILSLTIFYATLVMPTLPIICFQDDFSSKTKGWDLNERKGEHVVVKPEIADGKYRRFATFYEAPWYNWLPRVPLCSPKDFELTVDATIVEASHLEHDEASILICFRDSPDHSNYYLVHFSNAGYRVDVKKDGIVSSKNNWIQKNAFTLDIGSPNSFGVSVKGSHITLSANGKELASFNDYRLDQAGDIGLGIGTNSFTQTIIVEFDNLIIKEAQ